VTGSAMPASRSTAATGSGVTTMRAFEFFALLGLYDESGTLVRSCGSAGFTVDDGDLSYSIVLCAIETLRTATLVSQTADDAAQDRPLGGTLHEGRKQTLLKGRLTLDHAELLRLCAEMSNGRIGVVLETGAGRVGGRLQQVVVPGRCLRTTS
jgi:hypothetical protein